MVKSSIDDFTSSHFKTIIDSQNAEKKNISRVVVTSGKFYYELLAKQQEQKLDNIAIIRIEQYYPFDSNLFAKIIEQYKNASSFVWAQEEPKNMGAWSFIRDYLDETSTKLNLKKGFECISRKASPSPATGYLKIHNKEQDYLIKDVLAIK
jgi:2-oxoglutarate dehydrogenase E1 component